MIALSPVTGNIFGTPFTLSISGDYSVNWGDGNVESASTTISHIYSAANEYTVYVTNCDTTSSFSITALGSFFFDDSLIIAYDSLSAYTGCLNTLTLNLSSQSQTTTINLYNSGSSAQPAYTNESFWKHLNPEWGFYDVDGNNITQISIEGTPVYIDSHIVGYTAMSAVDFKDDMYGNRVLFFTVEELDKNVKINSRAYAALPYAVSAIVPTNLYITSDGLLPINELQWSDHDIPFMTSVVNSDLSCSTITHYACGYLTDIRFAAGCYGVPPETYTINTTTIDLQDENCFYTGGYTHQILNIPLSAIGENEMQFSTVECGENPVEAELEYIRRSPFQMVLTASGIFNIAGTVYSLTGQSEPFNIYRFENFHDFYRHGEEVNVYDLIKKYNHYNLDELPVFDQYLSSVFGAGDSLGKVYDKIQNLASDHNDLDVCTIDSIYDIAAKLDADILDFGLEFPEELRRIMDFTSIPLQKLIGSRKRKDGKITELIAPSDVISEGEIIAYREAGGSSEFDYYEVESTMMLSQLTGLGDISNVCFYRWQDNNQTVVVDSVINYNDPRNMLNRNSIKSSEWYTDNGILDETLNYILTKNLLNN